MKEWLRSCNVARGPGIFVAGGGGAKACWIWAVLLHNTFHSIAGNRCFSHRFDSIRSVVPLA